MTDAPTQKPNAPGPEVLREELINMMKARTMGKIASDKIEDLVDSFLAKIMEYYQRMATPEAPDDGAIMRTLLEAMLAATAEVIQAGAALSEAYPEGSPQRSRWQVAATELRHAGRAFIELFS